jgi:hypothetical protein
MTTGGLLFIPDISGFSQFVEKTEIEHCQFIIQKLLEVLINSNQLQLEVSEIEGDAILFYKFGTPPQSKEIYEQVEKMFCDFHHMLRSMSVRRLCQCGACKEAEHLSLKIITHQGEFTTYNIKEFSKLIGKDVIRAHQLLKNDIPEHEYWLVTDNLYRQHFKREELPEWMQWMQGSKDVENDSIGYQYVFLKPLLEKIPEQSRFPSAAQRGKKELIRVTKEMSAEFMQLFYLAVNLDLRSQWMEGVKAVDKMGNPNNIVGVSHRCVFENSSQELITSYIHASDTCIEYEETTADGQRTTHFQFCEAGEGRTAASIAVYVNKNVLKEMMFSLFMKKRIKAFLERTLNNLALLYERESAGDPHPNHHHHDHKPDELFHHN